MYVQVLVVRIPLLQYDDWMVIFHRALKTICSVLNLDMYLILASLLAEKQLVCEDILQLGKVDRW